MNLSRDNQSVSLLGMRLEIRPATPAGIGLTLQFIRELAEYEKLSQEVQADEGRLSAALFPEAGAPVAECLLAFDEGRPAGFAVYYTNFSTFLAKPGIHLEDLFVKPEFRRKGVGRALIREVAGIAEGRGCQRLEWTVLSWNEPALRFYRSIGAVHRADWNICRLEGAELGRFAESARS